MNTTQAIIFDLDGTLVDSLADIADATNRALSLFGYPVHGYEAYKYFVGNGIKNLVYESLPENKKDETSVMECLEVMMKEYRKSHAEKTKLYDGIPELLDLLTEKKLRMAILSNKADELTQLICSKLLDKWHFEIIMGANDRFPRKPNPESALYIANEMNILPQNILYLGDTNVDMQTANAAGMFAVGVTWGFRKREELLENGAKEIIDNPLELLKLL